MKEVAGTKPKAHPKTDSKTDSTIDSTIEFRATKRLLTTLFEVPDLLHQALPATLSQLHDGDLGFAPHSVYANFVSSLDGVTAIDPRAPGQGRIISGGVPADRFLMGLLRAFADVVLIGAGTLRAEQEHVWSPDRVYPPAGPAFAQLRSRLGLPPRLRLAVVTASGAVDPTLPALAGGLVLTGEQAAAGIRARAPQGVTVLSVGEGGELEMGKVVAALRAAGAGSILTEGGPHLFGQLLAARLVDEMFLTFSPVLAGRAPGGSQISLVEGAELLPAAGAWGRLLSLRQSGSHLFARYELRAGSRPSDARPS